MEFEEAILPGAEELILQVKQERYEEDSSNSNNQNLYGCTLVSVKEELTDHIDSGLINDSDEHELLTDIIKEEYTVTPPVVSQEFQQELDIKESIPRSPLNSLEDVKVGKSTGIDFKFMSSSKDDKHFECFSCRQTFKTKDQLKKHLNRKCFRPFECEICRRKFKCDAYLKTHRQTHFPGSYLIKKETNKPEDNHPNYAFVCTELGCNKTFSRKDRLLVHTRIHTGDKQYQCDEDGCGKKFNEWSNMEKHRRIHSDDKRYICDEHGCNKKFIAKCNLMEHKRIHMGDQMDKETGLKIGVKQFLCEICGKSIRHSSTYRKHLQIHTGEKPHVCDYEGCNKRFARRYRLKHHSYVHTGEKPFICTHPGCDRKYSDKSAFKKHVNTHN